MEVQELGMEKFDVMHVEYTQSLKFEKLNSFPFISTFKWHLMRIFKLSNI